MMWQTKSAREDSKGHKMGEQRRNSKHREPQAKLKSVMRLGRGRLHNKHLEPNATLENVTPSGSGRNAVGLSLNEYTLPV